MSKEEEAKLLYGMLFSLKSFSAKLSPVDMKTGFTSYTNRQPPRARNQATRGGFKSAVHTRASSNVPHLKELRSSVLPNRGADSHALSMNAFSP